jgi:hypothetical protein
MSIFPCPCPVDARVRVRQCLFTCPISCNMNVDMNMKSHEQTWTFDLTGAYLKEKNICYQILDCSDIGLVRYRNKELLLGEFLLQIPNKAPKFGCLISSTYFPMSMPTYVCTPNQ